MSQLVFRYRAINTKGKQVKGSLKARSREEAYKHIVASNLKPLRIDNRRGGRGRTKVTLKDLSHLTYQLSVLMEARIPIVDGLHSIAEQERNEGLRQIIEDVAYRIESGHTVTESLMPHSKVFGEVYIETIRAGEASGNMPQALAHLAGMLDRKYEMMKNIKGAMIYPISVVSVLVLAVTFLMIFVVPRFAKMFDSREMALPLPTQIVMFISDIFRNYWFILIGVCVGLVFLIRRAWSDQNMNCKLDTLLHRIPYMHNLLQGLAISQFAMVLGVSLRSGLNLIDALEISGKASGRPLMLADTKKMCEQVNQGGRLSDVIVECQYLPTFAKRMFASGEEAGELPRMCEIVARNYDREVSHLVKNISTVIEPVLIVGLASVVLVIALAIFLPMWNMAELMK